jgi:hypothetical protein
MRLHNQPQLETPNWARPQWQWPDAPGIPPPPRGRAGVGSGSGGSGEADQGEDWRPRFDAAAAAGEAVSEAAAMATAGGFAERQVHGGDGGIGPWGQLLQLCCGCEEVQLVLNGSLDWVEVAGWLAGALGPRVSLLALRVG